MGLSSCWADNWVCYKLYNKILSVQTLLFKGLNATEKDVVIREKDVVIRG
ncbi:hypothetical protein HanXRQr2_Chr03g0123481 [Helianthus annuus]|uniref:Uncharacterized protein n=1 Tax=Helianthus annuus TaxID=4232 RepID=A0A9K3JHZ0_HELAN|nr:hypothetical protein HanXRQr2_Chr03g0123481 [Helianthus annuus]